jgi:hypothetical protein
MAVQKKKLDDASLEYMLFFLQQFYNKSYANNLNIFLAGFQLLLILSSLTATNFYRYFFNKFSLTTNWRDWI